jgi:hypothetical protein
VTWYTWLEQGRRINASVQILDAIAGTLCLDQAERAHLYRLAEVPAVPDPAGPDDLPPEVQAILDSMALTLAAVYNGRYDVLAWNAPYAAWFPALVDAPPGERNALWHLFAAEPCCCTMLNRAEEVPRMVATLRATFGRPGPGSSGGCRRPAPSSPRCGPSMTWPPRVPASRSSNSSPPASGCARRPRRSRCRARRRPR